MAGLEKRGEPRRAELRQVEGAENTKPVQVEATSEESLDRDEGSVEAQKTEIEQQILDLQRKAKELEKAKTKPEKKDILEEIAVQIKELKASINTFATSLQAEDIKKKLDAMISQLEFYRKNPVDDAGYSDDRPMKILLAINFGIGVVTLLLVIFLYLK